MNNFAVAISGALFIVWMQRHGRWALFFKAMGGDIKFISRGSAPTGNFGGYVTSGPNAGMVAGATPGNPSPSLQGTAALQQIFGQTTQG